MMPKACFVTGLTVSVGGFRMMLVETTLIAKSWVMTRSVYGLVGGSVTVLNVDSPVLCIPVVRKFVDCVSL